MRTRSLALQILHAISAAGLGAAAASCGSGPWSDRLNDSTDGPTQTSRSCFHKEQLFSGTSATEAAKLACPSQSKLIELGHFKPAEPQAMAGSTLVDGPVEWNGDCCYLVTHWHTGRALVIDGQARTAAAVRRRDWLVESACVESALDDTDRAALARAWADDACAEHASVASFSRFALDLLALGAPADLVADAHRAALDEIEHARLCFALASRYAGAPIGPGALATQDAAVRGDLGAAAAAAVREGCIGETEAALLAQAQLDAATDPEVRRALTRIAADEANHAALAWRFVAWALREGGERVRREIAAAFDAVESGGANGPVPAGSDARAAHWSEHGRLSGDEVASVRARAHTEVIAPCARALLA